MTWNTDVKGDVMWWGCDVNRRGTEDTDVKRQGNTKFISVHFTYKSKINT